MLNSKDRLLLCLLGTLVAAPGCLAPESGGIAPATHASTQVRLDFFHRPLPELPLPNDVATRYDATSATHRRINASMVAPSGFERIVRTKIDTLDGWGAFQPITVPFDGPALDPRSVLKAHRDPHYALDDDVMFVVNVDRASPKFGTAYPLDFGNGNYPTVLEDQHYYWKNDPRGHTITLALEETDEDRNRNGKLDAGEDLNGNGVLDPGEDLDGDGLLTPPEDTDADGLLDVKNYLPGAAPEMTDLAGRADAMMTFIERQTNTLMGRLLEPLDERTTYAVVVTKRLTNVDGEPVGSPYPFVNHTSQTEDLSPLPEVLPQGTTLDDVAFAWTFTTQSTVSQMIAVRDGLYGHGVQAGLAEAFKPEIGEMLPLRDASAFPGMKKPYLLYGENLTNVMPLLLTQLLAAEEGSFVSKLGLESFKYVDYIVVGSYQSPQLFDRFDADGVWLPLDRQSWPSDLDRVPAKTRAETVYFTLVVPKKEVSDRGIGKPAPLVVYGHGYGSNHFEALGASGYLAKHGLATLAIDDPSHGVDLTDNEEALLGQVFKNFGIEAGGRALLRDRALDQNNDGRKDTGADFWTAYTFHTRDLVRQSVVDQMQLLRIFSTFDGTTRWRFDLDGDGQQELAGDFDSDGVVDVSAAVPVTAAGGSLGGITGMILGSLEPKVVAIAPLSGAGGLLDVGARTFQPGVPESVFLRVMGPLFAGTLDAATGILRVEQIVPDINLPAVARPLGEVAGVRPWDTFLVENLQNGERGCGFVDEAGQVRANVQSDQGDPMRITVYPGPQLAPVPDCVLLPSPTVPRAVLETLGADLKFQGIVHAKGSPITALGEGLGHRRAHPDLRRFQGFGQLVIEPGDPVTYARFGQREPITYATGETTGIHQLVFTTIGDMKVPANTSVTYARAAGLIDYKNDDARYGKPPNQMLIDTHMMEAVDTFKRYVDPTGAGVMLDIDNLSDGTDIFGTDVPRLTSPLRAGVDHMDAKGGVSGALFIYPVPTGEHGFGLPGLHWDTLRARCIAACAGTPDSCGCNDKPTAFDVGNFFINLVGSYLRGYGSSVSLDHCLSRDDCSGATPWGWLPPPAPRPLLSLP